MTPKEMLNDVRIQIDEPTAASSPFWRDGELMLRLHDAQGYIYRKMVRARDNLFLTSHDVDLVANKSTYDLPLNARLGTAWALIENRISSANPPLYVFDIRFQDHLMIEGPIGVSDPSDVNFYATMQRGQLRAVPTPGEAHADGLRVWYNPMFGVMHQGTVAAVSSATTVVYLPVTPTYHKGGISIDKIDKRADYYNGMDLICVTDTTTVANEGKVGRITDYAYDSTGPYGTVTVSGLGVVLSAAATYAVLCPIPEDFHSLVVARAAWLAAAKRPRLRKFLGENYHDAYQEGIGWITEEQSFRGGQVIPSDQGSY
jgi:hypothetical protein